MIKPNVTAERAVIGAILLDADKIMPEAIEVLDEDDFLVPELRTIYKTCCGHFVDGKPDERGYLTHTWAKALLANKRIEAVPGTHNWREYAKLISDTQKGETRAYKASQLFRGFKLLETGHGECQDKALQASEALNEEKHDNTVSAMQGFENFLNDYQKAERVHTHRD